MGKTDYPRWRLRTLLLGVTGYCNLRCQMCTIWHDPPSRLSTDHLQVVLEDPAVAEGLEYLGITGGEPLLHDGLGDLVGEAVRACHALREVCLTTNGSLPDRLRRFGARIVADCADAGRDCVINFSVDGVGEVHDAQRGRPGAFDKLTRSLDVARDLIAGKDGASMTLSAVVTRANADSVMDLLRWARGEDLSIVLSLPMQTDSYYRTDRTERGFLLLPEQRTRLTSLLKKLLLTTKLSRPEDALRRSHLEHLVAHLSGQPRRAACVFRDRAGCLITATGEVYLCGGGEDFRLGHLHEAAPSTLLARTPSNDVLTTNERTCEQCPSVCYLQVDGNRQ